MCRGLRGCSDGIGSSSSGTSSISTDGFRLAGAGTDFEVVVFDKPGFAAVGFFFPACSGADFFHLGAGPTKGAPARESRTWPRLVSPATGREKKNYSPLCFGKKLGSGRHFE
jgi:hypothetical protein